MVEASQTKATDQPRSVEAAHAAKMRDFDEQIKASKSPDEQQDIEQERCAYLMGVMNILRAYEKMDDDADQAESETEGHELEQKAPKRSLSSIVKVKSKKRRGTLYNLYMEASSGYFRGNDVASVLSPEKPKNIDDCEDCGCSRIKNSIECIMVCPQCGDTKLYMEQGQRGMSYEEEMFHSTTTSYAYKRSNHMSECVSSFKLQACL